MKKFFCLFLFAFSCVNGTKFPQDLNKRINQQKEVVGENNHETKNKNYNVPCEKPECFSIKNEHVIHIGPGEGDYPMNRRKSECCSFYFFSRIYCLAAGIHYKDKEKVQ